MNISSTGKATRMALFDFKSASTRTFHITWLTFFICFFAWFAIAPLMSVVRDELSLSHSQVGNIMMGSVAITILARLIFGWLCDRIGPRRSYCILLVAGSLPVMAIGLSHSYEMFLLFRIAIGITGASFVITQYHTTSMFAPNVVGSANAVAAGWGNMGGGVALVAMPLLFTALTGAGLVASEAWRLAMVVPGALMLLMAFVYYRFAQDFPMAREEASADSPGTKPRASLLSVCRDVKVWILCLCYAACFGVEITIDNIATLYFLETFHLSLPQAGLIAGLFGLMNLFARALGGLTGDRAGKLFGLKGRLVALAVLLALEAVGIILFSGAHSLRWAITALLVFALFLKMANGATYAAVPFVNTRAIGMVSGLVGAGGNVGAVLAAMLFASGTDSYRDTFFTLGTIIGGIACVALVAAFSLANRKVITDDAHLLHLRDSTT